MKNSIKYTELIDAFKNPETKDLAFWKQVAEIERGIPRYNNRYSWWERIINFCNTYLREHAIANSKITIGGLWDVSLELNKLDDHETFHGGPGKPLADFYFEPTGDKIELKTVCSLEYGLLKYCDEAYLPYKADELIMYCQDTKEYYVVTHSLAQIDLDNYGTYKNKLGIELIYYVVDLPEAIQLEYKKPVSDVEEVEILSGLQEYTYINKEMK